MVGDASELNGSTGVIVKHTFTKEERLCSKRLIDSLFHGGSSFVLYPYRVVLLKRPESEGPEGSAVQCIISVSKRRFKRAVARNLIKRRMREAYRLQKSDLYKFVDEHSLAVLLAFQYVGKEILPYKQMSQRMTLVLERLKDEISKNYLG